MQFAADALALRFLAADQASSQLAVALVDALPVRHVADDAEYAVVAGAHKPRFELPETAVQWELVFDHDRLVGPRRAIQRVHEDIGQVGRHNVADCVADELARRHVQQVRILRVVVDERPVKQDNEHQIGNRT